MLGFDYSPLLVEENTMEWWLGSEIFFTFIIKARSQWASVVPTQL